MKCRLCEKEEHLCKSHIIPEFFYKSMYDSIHRFYILNEQASIKNEPKQKGLYEKLLCKKCESKLSNYETYFAKFLTQKSDLFSNLNIRTFEFTGADYRLVKLFLISILWRAGISKLDFFKDINLGPHESRLKTMLQNECAGKYYEYGCIIIHVNLQNSKSLNGFFSQPETIRTGGYNVCRFVFGGFIWFFYVSSHNHLFKYKNYFLSEEGKLIIHNDIFENFEFLIKSVDELHKKGKLKNT